MSEVKTVLPELSFENGVAKNFTDLRALIDGVQVEPITNKISAQSMASLKKNVVFVSDSIKKAIKQDVKNYENSLIENNGTLIAIKDTADAIKDDITENQNKYNVGRLKELEIVLKREIDERNQSYHLKQPITIKSEWLKISNFTATGKPTGALTKLLNLEFIVAQARENEKPKLTEIDAYKLKVKYVFAELFEQFDSEEIYSGKDFQQAVASKKPQLD
ncbi:hypothetical protein [Leuconostoc citreum]|uniref:hypothetical protein n=1 Tax=Leuconostoc citreum TaxID=33964 RepID=UPI001C1FD842|nr:hypothetical protein [Leuconostoc citreum]MBU7450007.1 hypothetical protein [Leuconostoc citreum]MCT3076954.1 hypothetical protein [Leuconostoc citreum]